MAIAREIYNNTEPLKLSNAADQKDKDRIGKIKNRLDYLAAAVGLVADLIAILEVLS